MRWSSLVWETRSPTRRRCRSLGLALFSSWSQQDKSTSVGYCIVHIEHRTLGGTGKSRCCWCYYQIIQCDKELSEHWADWHIENLILLQEKWESMACNAARGVMFLEITRRAVSFGNPVWNVDSYDSTILLWEKYAYGRKQQLLSWAERGKERDV